MVEDEVLVRLEAAVVGEGGVLGEDFHEQHVLVELLQLFVAAEHRGQVELRDAGAFDDHEVVFDQPLGVDVPQPVSERLALVVEDQDDFLRVGVLVLRDVGLDLCFEPRGHDVYLADLGAVRGAQDVVQDAGACDFLQTLV